MFVDRINSGLFLSFSHKDKNKLHDLVSQVCYEQNRYCQDEKILRQIFELSEQIPEHIRTKIINFSRSSSCYLWLRNLPNKKQNELLLILTRLVGSKERLKEGDKYKTKPELGAEIVKELKEMGFNIKRVLADSLYGESDSNFVSVIGELAIEYAVGIRSNHGVWLPKGQRVRANRWREFKHIKWDKKEETRYIREIIYGKRRTIQFYDSKNFNVLN